MQMQEDSSEQVIIYRQLTSWKSESQNRGPFCSVQKLDTASTLSNHETSGMFMPQDTFKQTELLIVGTVDSYTDHLEYRCVWMSECSAETRKP